MKTNKALLMTVVLIAFVLAACSAPASTSVSPAASDPTQAPAEAMPVASTQAPADSPVLPFEITIDAADHSFTAPEIVRSGWMLVNLTNSGQEPHHVQFLRLNDGVSLDEFEAALKQGEGPALAMTQQVGGVGAIAPGISAQAVINLPAGEYAILCFIPSPGDGIPHLAKGMIKGLTVQDSSGGTAAEPEADLAITLQDFTFDMPATLPAGPMVIQVTNNGPEPHEWNLLRLEDGKTVQDVLGFLTAPDGPPPFIPIGGMNGLDVGKTGYVEFDFEPGTYVAICNIPSPKAEGHPHFTLGMVKQFEVTSSEVSSFPTGKFVSVKDGALAHQFNEDGTFAFLVGDIPVVEGTYRTEGDLYMELTNNDSDPTCQEHPAYRWQFDGETLSFSPVTEDTCRGRREAFGDTYTMSD
jgi:hypothetical protein